MTSPADVSSLKHEVAELWRRFKTDPEPPNAPDPRRQALLDSTRALDAKHKALSARRDAIKSATRLARAGDDSRRVAFTALGFVVGVGLGSAALALGLDTLANLTCELSQLSGALLLAATVPAPLLLRLR
jgi:hypothetical protein